MSYLLDTNIVSELRKRMPDPAVVRWYDGVNESDLFLSVLVVGEIRQGIERLRSRDPQQAALYDAWLSELHETFHDRLLSVSLEVAEVWGRLNASRSLPVVDGLLAATAIAHHMVLVTRNVADVVGTSAQVLNPFAP